MLNVVNFVVMSILLCVSIILVTYSGYMVVRIFAMLWREEKEKRKNGKDGSSKSP